jgi:Cu(I)/Ag(I) efflux system membrane fusion protein
LRIAAVAALALLCPALIGCDGDPRVEPSEPLAEARDDTWPEHLEKHRDPTYICPMHPQIVRSEPGTCPICGMDLVLQEVEPDGGDDAPVVTISPAVVQNMGVRTAKAERGRLWKRIDTMGRIEYDEDRMAHIHPRADGWVERLYVTAEGEPVTRGQTLLDLYSPKIVNAQEEFLLALQERSTRSGISPQRTRQLVDSARTRLRLLEVPESVIEEIERTGEVRHTIPLQSSHEGVVIRLGLRDGMYVDPAMEMFTIADITKVWVEVDVFEHQMDWVRVGRPADMRVPARPGRTWEGAVDYVYPELDPETRTLRVRLRFDNPDGVLKPNMFADIIVWGGPKHNVLSIPRAALIMTGEHEKVVLALGEGRFRPIEVETGMRTGERVEVLDGLVEDDEVVVSGQFLIDSESNLRASFRRMAGPDPTSSAGGGGAQRPPD